METFSVLLAICAGNSPVPGEFLAQRPVTQNFDVFFDLRLNKRLSKQSWGWWFETLSRRLWRHCNDKSSPWPWEYYGPLRGRYFSLEHDSNTMAMFVCAFIIQCYCTESNMNHRKGGLLTLQIRILRWYIHPIQIFCPSNREIQLWK